MTVKLSTLAQLDLEDIWEFIATDSIETANNYLLNLQERLNNLSEQPFSGRKRKEFAINLLSFPIDNYVIFYEMESEKQIYIVRILHSARDISSILLN